MTEISVFFDFSTIRLSFIADVIDPQPDHRAPELAEFQGYPYIGIRDINSDGSINVETARKVKLQAVEKQQQAFRLIAGDIVFCKVGTLGLPKRIQPVPQMALSATLVLIKPKHTVDPQFLYYALDSNPVINQCQLESTGSTRQALGIQQIRRFEVPFVSLNKQKAIASFLDRKTAVIDTLITKKQRLMQLLEEKRVALIKQAVTKGLNSNVLMKNSGSSWIGETPKHWNVRQLKYLCVLQRGFDLPSQDRKEGTFPIYGGGGVTGYHNIAMVQPPGVVTGRYGTVGEVYLVEEPFWPLNTSLYVKEFWGNSPAFVRYLLSVVPIKSYSAVMIYILFQSQFLLEQNKI